MGECQSWVSANVRIYDRLFNVEAPEKLGGDDEFLQAVNPDSHSEIVDAIAEPSLAQASPETVFQFEREGYFVADRYNFDAASGQLIFNKTIGLRDSWGKALAKPAVTKS